MHRPPLQPTFTAVVAVLLLVGADRPAPELDGQAQRLTEYLVGGRTRELYRLFLPAFQQEQSFARFDSAYRRWVRGRTFSRSRSRASNVQGLGGHVSTWVIFEEEPDYSYIYSSWLQTADGWRVMWMTNVLDQSFQYGISDSAAMDRAAETALRHLLDGGLGDVDRRLPVPSPVVAVWDGRRGERTQLLDGRDVIWLSVDEARRGGLPGTPFLFHFALVRVLGDIAIIAVDLRPTDPDDPGVLGRRRSIRLYFEYADGGWRYNSTSRVW